MTILEVSVTYGIEGEVVKIVGFLDDGYNCSVIKNSLATKLGLWGTPVTLELGTVNATTTIDTMLYVVELLDKEGTRYLIKAFGLESLSGRLPSISLVGIKHEFSAAVHNQSLAGKISQIYRTLFKVSCPKKVSLTPLCLTQSETKSINNNKNAWSGPCTTL